MSRSNHGHEGSADGVDGGNGTSAQARLRQGLTVVALSLLILMLSYLILQELADILRPLLIAAFLCYLFVPGHGWLVRHKIPSVLAYLVITAVVLGASYGVASMTFRSIGKMSKDLPTYVQKLQWATERATTDFKQKLAGIVSGHPLHSRRPTTSAAAAPAGSPATAEQAFDAPASTPTTGRESQYRLISTNQLIALSRSGFEAFLGLFTSMFVVAVFMLFLLAEVAGFERRIVSAFGAERADHVLAVTKKINTAVAQYIRVKTFTSFILGVGTTGVLWFFGIEYAVLWGILTFFANFVPYIGSMFAVALPILMAYVQFDSLILPITLLIILTTGQMVVGYLIEPRMIGRKLGVSPLMILLSLAFWGLLWGVPGMVLSAPLIVTVKIVLENIEQTRPIAMMMSSD